MILIAALLYLAAYAFVIRQALKNPRLHSIRVKLTKVNSNHNFVRTDTIVGFTKQLPTIGQSFVMEAAPLDSKMDLRLLQTTPVQDIDRYANAMYFDTVNSRYRLDILVDDSE